MTMMSPHKIKAVLGIVASLAFAQALASAPAEGSYSLKTVEAKPIPKAEFFKLWREVALKPCSEKQSPYNLTKDECLSVVSARADTCAAQIAGATPALISTQATSREIGRKYLDCATPYYFCKGVEVKTVEEARVQCR